MKNPKCDNNPPEADDWCICGCDATQDWCGDKRCISYHFGYTDVDTIYRYWRRNREYEQTNVG